MKKNISKEQIVETTLDIMQGKSDLSSINLREIARHLGCAHTNLYNYFPSYSDLLWETHAVVMEKFLQIMKEKLNDAHGAEQEFIVFFKTISEIYLEKKGWFKLAWHEYIGGEQPQRDIEATAKTNDELAEIVTKIWRRLSGQYPKKEQVAKVLHITHCYIVGEISDYLLGRSSFKTEDRLTVHISNEAIQLFSLYLIEE